MPIRSVVRDRRPVPSNLPTPDRDPDLADRRAQAAAAAIESSLASAPIRRLRDLFAHFALVWVFAGPIEATAKDVVVLGIDGRQGAYGLAGQDG